MTVGRVGGKVRCTLQTVQERILQTNGYVCRRCMGIRKKTAAWFDECENEYTCIVCIPGNDLFCFQLLSRLKKTKTLNEFVLKYNLDFQTRYFNVASKRIRPGCTGE